MRVPRRWLAEFVDIDVSVEKLVELLNFSGTKVEMVHRFGAGIDGVVVAEVTAIASHPNADNLTLVDVLTPAGSQRVVCGARNFSVGDKVPLAQPGATLPGMTITQRRFRGETSEGMLCSAAELSVSDDHSGILVLPPEAEPGAGVVELLGLDDDVLELEVTPNRPDCMGMLGVAREVAALLGHELRWPRDEVSLDFEGPEPDVAVEIADHDGCPRYVARLVESVTAQPSPAWLAARLVAAGLRPISNLVDVTNYVMLETGQPLHAFDASRVQAHRIIVRRAEAGEELTTLDGIERTLASEDLVIADRSRPIALAGVMGGAGSEVSDSTTDVILESACFDRVSVSFTSRRHLLRTEASARFERGSDPEMAPVAAARAAVLLARLGGGRLATRPVDANPRPWRARPITLRPARTGRILGIEVPPQAQARHLSSIGIEVESKGGDLVALVPSWRPDLVREVDLIEEVARLEGFDRLPATLPPGDRGGLEPRQAAERALARALAALGLYEAWTPAFMPAGALDALGLGEEDPARRAVTVANPMTEDERHLRTTLLPGLLRSLSRNLAHGAPGAALFELARVYRPGGARLPDEPRLLAAVCAGERVPLTWSGAARRWDFFAVKGVVDAALAALRLGPLAYAPGGGMPWHPTRVASVSLSRRGPAGVLGELHPEVCRRHDLPEGSVAFEMDLEHLWKALPDRPRAFALPRFPPVYLDVAVVVDGGVPAGAVRRVIEEAGEPELASVRLFDLYEGEQVPPGKKSLAFALELREPDRTMTDAEAAAVRDRIVAAISDRTGGELRS